MTLTEFKDWIFHSVVICRPGLCKQDGIMKMRLAAIIDHYPLRLALLLEKAYSDGADLILIKLLKYQIKSLVGIYLTFSFSGKRSF